MDTVDDSHDEDGCGVLVLLGGTDRPTGPSPTRSISMARASRDMSSRDGPQQQTC